MIKTTIDYKNIYKRLMIIVFLLVIISIGYMIYAQRMRFSSPDTISDKIASFTKKVPTSTQPTATTSATSLERPIFFEANGVRVQIKEQEIIVEPIQEKFFVEERNRITKTISKKNFPQLFAEDNSTAFLTVTVALVRNIPIIQISKNHSDHGSYHPGEDYFIDPNTLKLLYKSSDVCGRSDFWYSAKVLSETGELHIYCDPYSFWSLGIPNGLPIEEFVQYNLKSNSFELSNAYHTKEFQELQKTYDDIAENKCFYRGEHMTVAEVQRTYGNDAKCDDDILAQNLPADEFITVGQFQQLQQIIQRNILGENVSMNLMKK